MMAHSVGTARDSYFTKGTEVYNAGMAKIFDMEAENAPEDPYKYPSDEDEADARIEEMQHAALEKARQLTNKRLALSKTSREVGARCAISSRFRNQILVDIISMEVPSFTYKMLTNIPSNTVNRYMRVWKWNDLFFSYLTNSHSTIFEMALEEVIGHDTLQDFAITVRKSLYLFSTKQNAPLLQFTSVSKRTSSCKSSTADRVQTELQADMAEILRTSPTPTPVSENEQVAGPSRTVTSVADPLQTELEADMAKIHRPPPSSTPVSEDEQVAGPSRTVRSVRKKVSYR